MSAKMTTSRIGFFQYTEDQLVVNIITALEKFRISAVRSADRSALNAILNQTNVKRLIEACEYGTLGTLDSRVALHRFVERVIKLQMLFKWVGCKGTEYIELIRKDRAENNHCDAFTTIREMIIAFSIYAESIANPLSEKLKKEIADTDDHHCDRDSILSTMTRIHELIGVKYAKYSKEAIQWLLRYAKGLICDIKAVMEFMLHKMGTDDVFTDWMNHGFVLSNKPTWRRMSEDDEMDTDKDIPGFDGYLESSSSSEGDDLAN